MSDEWVEFFSGTSYILPSFCYFSWWPLGFNLCVFVCMICTYVARTNVFKEFFFTFWFLHVHVLAVRAVCCPFLCCMISSFCFFHHHCPHKKQQIRFNTENYYSKLRISLVPCLQFNRYSLIELNHIRPLFRRHSYRRIPVNTTVPFCCSSI